MDEANQYCNQIGIITHGRVAALGNPTELKSRLMKDVITVVVDGKYSLIQVYGTLFVGQSGDELSFTAENGREAFSLLADALNHAGNKVRTMALCEPSLGYVFLQSVGKQ